MIPSPKTGPHLHRTIAEISLEIVAEDGRSIARQLKQEDEMANGRLAYSKKEAAAATSISLRSIDYLIGKGQLKAVKIGRRVVIPARDLEKLICNGAGPVRKQSSVATAREAVVS